MGGGIKIIILLRFAPGGNLRIFGNLHGFFNVFYKNADNAKTLGKWKKWVFVCFYQVKRVMGKRGFLIRFFLANEGFNGANGFRRGKRGKA